MVVVFCPRIIGIQYRKCSIDTFTSLMSGECKKTFDDLIACNKYYEYDYGKKCKQIRQSLLECAVKNGMGEIGK